MRCTYEYGVQQEVQVDTPFHLDSVVHDEVGQKDDCNVTPEGRTEVIMTMFET
jgi:hypothetical protein